MTELYPTIPGGKYTNVEGDLCLALGSRDLAQPDIKEISEIDGIKGVLFYYAIFRDVDLSVLERLGLRRISVLHGNFCDTELEQIGSIKTLRILKLYDTQVSEMGVAKIKERNPLLQIK